MKAETQAQQNHEQAIAHRRVWLVLTNLARDVAGAERVALSIGNAREVGRRHGLETEPLS